MKNQLICIAGPTASGKTALSVELAKKLNTSIVSADSMQIYEEMDIGTAKPTIEERQGVPHYMLDVCPATEEFSVARYAEMADAACQKILQQGKIPIVVGGTGLYMNALIEGNVFSGDEKDAGRREELEQMALEQGNSVLHEMLRKIDPESAEKLHPNNRKRVIRAIEVYEQTGMTIGEWNRLHKPPKPRYQAYMLGLCPESREILYDRINRRVDDMMAQGLLTETETLWKKGLLVGTAGQAIGYKELLPYLQNQADLADCVEKLKQDSRNYAKRQLTWLKKDDRIHWIYYNKKEDFPHVLLNSTNFLQEHGLI